MSEEELDIMYMERALQLAKIAGVDAAPNPMVGAVIVVDQKIIGEGYHQRAGEAHAEVNAILSVKNKKILRHATLYVTLEPCVHVGKTPPCTSLIIEHQFKRVVIGCLDSNVKVAGKGVQLLKDAGIEVKTGVLEEQARWLNRRFFTFHEKKRPFVVLKWAETRDGFMDRLPEERAEGINWITQPKMKLHVHNWRRQEQAIMVGWKTINNDNPQLNVRKLAGTSPHRFIIDPQGNVNIHAKVFTDGKPTTVLSLRKEITGLPKHVELIQLEKVTSVSILQALYQKEILSVFIEGGAQTLTHFISDNLWDEAYQLIGESTFSNGIEAPILSQKTLIDSVQVERDIIHHYRSRVS